MSSQNRLPSLKQLSCFQGKLCTLSESLFNKLCHQVPHEFSGCQVLFTLILSNMALFGKWRPRSTCDFHLPLQHPASETTGDASFMGCPRPSHQDAFSSPPPIKVDGPGWLQVWGAFLSIQRWFNLKSHYCRAYCLVHLSFHASFKEHLLHVIADWIQQARYPGTHKPQLSVRRTHCKRPTWVI